MMFMSTQQIQGVPCHGPTNDEYGLYGMAQPAPVPPKRELVALPPQPKASLHAEGRFTVLSYNILADLYATVRRASSLPLCWAGLFKFPASHLAVAVPMPPYRRDWSCSPGINVTPSLCHAADRVMSMAGRSSADMAC